MKFMHAADLHIDSQLKGLDALGHAPAERIRAATRDAVVILIDTALRERVDFVVLAGDIFDGQPIPPPARRRHSRLSNSRQP